MALMARSVNRSKTAEIGVSLFRFLRGSRREFVGVVERRWLRLVEREIPR